MNENKGFLGNANEAKDPLKKEFDMIDEHIPVKFETRETGDAIQELKSTKEYLTIVLKELEEVRQELFVKEQIKKTLKKRSFWKLVSVLELLLLVVVLCFFGMKYVKDKDNTVESSTKNHQETEENSKGNGKGASELSGGNDSNHSEVTTRKQLLDLDGTITGISKSAIAPFEVSVEEVYGYEYLCFSYGKNKVYYRNEFELSGDSARMNMMVDNGNKMIELDWSYDLTGDLTLLCPKIGNFRNEEDSQLLFTMYDEAKSKSELAVLPKELRMIELKNLWEYNTLILEEALLNAFALSYKEEGMDGTASDTFMVLSVNSAEYTYRIPKENYINAVYYEENPLWVTDYGKTDITEDSINLTAILYLSEDAYLGQVTAEVEVSGMDLVLKNVRYASYALANQEDAGLGGIIEPFPYAMDDYVAMYGKKGERFLVELSKTLERVPYDWENLAEDVNGFLTYYEGGEALSIPGIDVSRYQGNIDWDKVAASGVRYAFIRLGYRAVGSGNIEIDQYFIQNIEGANRVGIPVGVYFFSQATNEVEAIEEAETVLNEIKGYKVEYPIVFDTETVTVNGVEGAANHLSRQQRTDVAKAFCEHVKAAGHTPMVYANTKWMIMGIDLEQLTEYDTWFAYYGNNLTFPYKFQILQYSDSGRVPGISSNVDLNLSFVDYADSVSLNQ